MTRFANLLVLLLMIVAGVTDVAAVDNGKKKPAPAPAPAVNPFAGLRLDVLITTSEREVKRDQLSFTATHLTTSSGEVPYKVTPAGKGVYQFTANIEQGGRLTIWQAKGTPQGLKDGIFTQGSILTVGDSGERTVWTIAPAAKAPAKIREVTTRPRPTARRVG